MTHGFIRHGQTDWNLRGLLQGSSDIPLNDTGRAQAREAVDVLRAAGDWDVVVSSPLVRARETAEIVAAGLGIELGETDDDLIERDYGQGEGMVVADAYERWPGLDGGGVEPLDAVVGRAMRALARIDAAHPGKRVAIVCHGTLIRYTLQSLSGLTFDHIKNGAVATFERDGDGWRVLTVNDEAVQATP